MATISPYIQELRNRAEVELTIEAAAAKLTVIYRALGLKLTPAAKDVPTYDDMRDLLMYLLHDALDTFFQLRETTPPDVQHEDTQAWSTEEYPIEVLAEGRRDGGFIISVHMEVA